MSGDVGLGVGRGVGAGVVGAVGRVGVGVGVGVVGFVGSRGVDGGVVDAVAGAVARGAFGLMPVGGRGRLASVVLAVGHADVVFGGIHDGVRGV